MLSTRHEKTSPTLPSQTFPTHRVSFLSATMQSSFSSVTGALSPLKDLLKNLAADSAKTRVSPTMLSKGRERYDAHKYPHFSVKLKIFDHNTTKFCLTSQCVENKVVLCTREMRSQTGNHRYPNIQLPYTSTDRDLT